MTREDRHVAERPLMEATATQFLGHRIGDGIGRGAVGPED